MDELISKRQAIDALRGYLVGERCPDDGTLTARLIENEVINKLPSVQPTFDARDTQYNLPIGTDLISRKQAIEVVQKRHMMLSKEKVLLINDLEKLPSAQSKKGKWKNIVDGIEYTWGTCDTCGAHIPMPYKYYEYCPHCGTKNEVKYG